MVLLELTLVVQLTELFQKFDNNGVIVATCVALMYSLAPFVRSIFHPGESDKDGVLHSESSTV